MSTSSARNQQHSGGPARIAGAGSGWRAAALAIVVSATATLSSASAVGADASEGVGLAPKFVAGQVDRYLYVTEGTSERDAIAPGSEPFAQKVRQETAFVRKVISSDSEGAKIEVRVERAMISIEMGSDKKQFDSAQPKDADGENEMAGSVREAIDRSITLSVSPTGEITEITGNKGFEGRGMRYANAVVADDVIRMMVGQTLALPEAPATMRAGESWKRDHRVGAPPVGLIAIAHEYTLKDVTGGVAKIAVTGKHSVTGAVGPAAIPSKVKESRIEGTLEWDTTAGELKSMKSDEVMHLESTIKDRAVGVRNRSTTEITRLAPGAGSPAGGAEKKSEKPAS